MTSLGFQVSSLKPFLTTPRDVLTTFHKLYDIGYRELQIQWISPDVPDEFVLDALQETELACVATQDYYHIVRDNFDRFIYMNKLWSSRYLTVSRIPREYMSGEGLKAFSRELCRIADALRDNGIILTFHPVAADFAAVEGRNAVEWLLEYLPNDVQLTMCIYHVVKAGLNPLEMLERYRGRVDLVHFKDSVVLQDGSENLMPIGQGRIEWDQIFKACHETGVKWGFVEQENWQKDAFVCAKESYDYVTSHGIVSLVK